MEEALNIGKSLFGHFSIAEIPEKHVGTWADPAKAFATFAPMREHAHVPPLPNQCLHKVGTNESGPPSY